MSLEDDFGEEIPGGADSSLRPTNWSTYGRHGDALQKAFGGDMVADVLILAIRECGNKVADDLFDALDKSEDPIGFLREVFSDLKEAAGTAYEKAEKTGEEPGSQEVREIMEGIIRRAVGATEVV